MRSATFVRGITMILLALAIGGCASGSRKEAVTVDRVVQMSRDGVPPAQIIEQMRASGTVYPVSGSRFAELKSQGVADEVLDYMQSTYLEAARRDAYRYYDPYAGYPYWGMGWWGARGMWGGPGHPPHAPVNSSRSHR